MPTIALAGATGRLGHLIARELLTRGAQVRALVRPGTGADKLKGLEGASIVEVELTDAAALRQALTGADGVISALNGLRDVIVDRQTDLLNAAVAAKVPRFIPSDYAADITKLADGENRNFDLRRAFRERLLAAPIRSISVLNGGFMELLLWGRSLDAKGHTVSHFGSPDTPLRLHHDARCRGLHRGRGARPGCAGDPACCRRCGHGARHCGGRLGSVGRAVRAPEPRQHR